MSEHIVDARKLLCPMPVIKAQNAIKELNSGDIVLVLGTDPGVQEDIPAWCRINGHKLISMEVVDFEFHLRIEVRNEN